MYKYVLFDLDGTLTDSKEGIINSVAYALEKMGISSEGRLDPHVIVGPPLLDTFEG
ncbi:MAG: HAD hydrolase-like protein, partial [Megasphaera sp.]|nr:HAD hydrolase-like protein [Megasphaera sp.]